MKFVPFSRIKDFLLTIKAWFLKLFFRANGVEDPKPENVELIKNIRIMACVFGMPRKQIEKDVEKELTGENLKLAYEEMDRVFQGREKIDRETIRKFRRKNNISFSSVVKKNLR